jgi:hypothetical protein
MLAALGGSTLDQRPAEQTSDCLRSGWDGFLLAAPTLERVEQKLLQPNLNGRAVLRRTILDGVHSSLHELVEAKFNLKRNGVYEFDRQKNAIKLTPDRPAISAINVQSAA